MSKRALRISSGMLIHKTLRSLYSDVVTTINQSETPNRLF